MIRVHWVTAAIALTHLTQAAPVLAVELPLQVVVKRQDRGAPVAFERVGGFLLKRNNAAFVGGTCLDTSNSKGEVTCKLTCHASDKDFNLLLVPPKKEEALIVAGMSSPPAPAVEVSNCKIVSKVPVELVYRTEGARAAELMARSPAVFAAAVSNENGILRFKPFKEAAPQLEQLARNPANRDAIGALSELANLHVENKATGKPTVISESAADYAFGAPSVVLLAQTTDALGPQEARQIVSVSAAPRDYSKSVSAVSKAIDVKPVLSPEQVRLQKSVQAAAFRANTQFSF